MIKRPYGPAGSPEAGVRVTDAKRLQVVDGYDVTATVRNIGTGTMPVEIAAVAGERWGKEGASTEAGAKPNLGYHEARETVTLGAGESKSVTIHCAFTPERVVIDPDVRVLPLRRKLALQPLK